MKMKNVFKKLGLFGVIIGLSLSMTSCGYNSMVKKEESVSAAWGQVENVYQRRMDLIGNLVKTVSAEAGFEKSTLVAVQEARSNATKVTIDASKLTPENVKQFQLAQDGLGNVLSRLMSVAENYPNLKSNEAFHDMMSELEGTENRIAVERRNFNTAVQDYNSTIRSFPENLTAKMFGFQTKGYFTASAGADKAPDVKFDIK